MTTKVLIVDDANFARFRIRKFLESTDRYEVIGEAEDGEDAIQKLGYLKPDLITLDMTMPKMDGLEFIKKFRTVNKQVKIVVLSALGHEIMVTKAIEAGADDFLAKPFSTERLLKVLDGVVGKIKKG